MILKNINYNKTVWNSSWNQIVFQIISSFELFWKHRNKMFYSTFNHSFLDATFSYLHGFFMSNTYFQPSLSVALLFHELNFKCCLGVA